MTINFIFKYIIYMNTDELVEELNEIIKKLKMRLIYYQTENASLKKKISELKKYVRNN